MNKKHLIIGIILFGSLIGISEVLVAQTKPMHSSVVLTSISLSLFLIARFLIPKAGSTAAITVVALLFKMLDFGVFTCGPTALLMLGGLFEICCIAIGRFKTISQSKPLISATLSAMLYFGIFALFQLYIVQNPKWDTSRLFSHSLIKGPITAVIVFAFGLLSIPLISKWQKSITEYFLKRRFVFDGLSGAIIMLLWIMGYVISH